MADKAAFLAYLRAHPKVTPTAAAKALGVAGRTATRWAKQDAAEKAAKAKAAPRAPKPSPSRAGVPAEALTPDDRDQALSIVRDARAIAARRLADLRAQLEAGEPVQFDAREAQALLNFQRAAAEVLDTHPGLMEMAHGAGGLGGGGQAGGGDAGGRLRDVLREAARDDAD